MTHNKWLFLQLFGGEGGAASGGSASAGDGGGSAATGETAVDAEQQRLRELGVPEDKLKRRAQRMSSKKATDTIRNVPKESKMDSTEQVAAAETTQPTEEEAPTSNDATETAEAPKRMTWAEIMADPEYNAEMQNTMKARLKKSQAAEENLAKLAPAIELLARRHNLDPNNMDYDALAEAINDDDGYYEDKALEMGVSVETAKKIDQQERDTERKKAEEQRNLEEQKLVEHFHKLEAEGNEIKETFPSFDLATELQNPVFRRMTSPNVGISVADAYYAVHRKEIQTAAMKATAQQTAEKLSNAIRSGSQRPTEAGTSSQAPSNTTFDYRNASRAEREALKREIRMAAARGEKVYPGGTIPKR